MKSLSIKNASVFNIEAPLMVLQDGVQVGSISIDDPATVFVDRTQFNVFNAIYNEVVNEHILVTDNDDELVAYNQYQVPNSFKIFYSQQQRLLIAAAPSHISKAFFKALQATEPEEVHLQNYNFNIPQLIERLNNKTSVTFTVDEDGVQRKRFTGDAVIDNLEAANAVENGQATFLIGKTELLGRERTLGFNVAGSLLIYSHPTDLDNQTYPFLNITLAALKELVDPR